MPSIYNIPRQNEIDGWIFKYQMEKLSGITIKKNTVWPIKSEIFPFRLSKLIFNLCILLEQYFSLNFKGAQMKPRIQESKIEMKMLLGQKNRKAGALNSFSWLPFVFVFFFTLCPWSMSLSSELLLYLCNKGERMKTEKSLLHLTVQSSYDSAPTFLSLFPASRL